MGLVMDLSIALWTNCAVIDLSYVFAVYPLAAAITERGILLGAGVAQRIFAEKDALRARFAFSTAGANKALSRHDSPSFPLYIDNISTKSRLLRYCATAVCCPAYSPDTSCDTESAADRPASQKWR
jgi:hypothetical protein